MANTILVTVIAKDGISLIGCPTKFHLPCPTNTVIDGRDFYFHSDILQQTWKFPPVLTAATLPAVSFPAAYVKSNGHDYYIIANQDESPAEPINEIISELCNQCCAASPGGEPEAVATVVNIIPPLYAMANGKITQDCSTGTCTYSYFDTLPTDSTNNYSITFVCGGVAHTSGNTKFTTIAAALAWAIANLGAYGTWTNPTGQQLKVSGATCAQGTLFHTNY